MIIQYAITLLRYTIFYNISCVIRKKIIKPNSANIKYTIIRCKMNANDIKYIKLYKSDLITRLFIFENNNKILLLFR